MQANGKVIAVSGDGLHYVNGLFVSSISRENTKTKVSISDNDELPSQCDDNVRAVAGELVIEHETGVQLNRLHREVSERIT